MKKNVSLENKYMKLFMEKSDEPQWSVVSAYEYVEHSLAAEDAKETSELGVRDEEI